ncbi:TOMM precursor leader peptide-binding protein [Streptomyces sp. NPDC059524]|uniref:TOMM precursor leader peptide-binding protein n=1 Tax=Streptomyces sp. NPDC059524 TaxID=3346856 RepID=UPI0036A2DFB1
MTVPGGDRAEPARDTGNAVGFKLHLHPVVIPGEAAYLVSRQGVTALRGEHAECLVPLLDGTRDVAGILREAGRTLDPDSVLSSLEELTAAGLLRLHPRVGSPGLPGDPTRSAEAYWDLAGLDGAATAARLAAGALWVETIGGADPDAVRAACAANGIGLAGDPEGAALTLVVCDDYLAPSLGEIDRAHRAAGRAWLPVRGCGAEPWIGPFFQPDEGPCWHCLRVRLAGHRAAERPVRRALGIRGPLPRPAASLAAGRSLAVNLAVLEAAKWLAGIRDAAQGRLHTWDTLRMRATEHRVDRLPQCRDCGDPDIVAERVRRPFVPVSRPKAGGSGGGHRALTPDQMLARHGHLIDPVTGIVKEIRPAPHTPDGLNSFVSGPNLAMGAHTLAGLRTGLRALSGGKGITETEARVGALCEAVERYSGTRHGDEPVIVDSYRGLGAEAVHPYACQLYDERQFRERELWNERHSSFQYVPEPFDADRPTEWTPVWSLTHGRRRLLPTSMLYFTRGAASADGLYADSNGNAAGSSREDALIQGFFEVVERDAVALWWYNRTRQPGVDIDAFDEPYAERIRSVCARTHRELWVLDLTSDLGIPVFAALSRRTDKPAEDIVFGFGAHFDPRVALRRALSELGQLLPAVYDARPDGTGYAVTDPEPLHWWYTAKAAHRPYLVPDPDRRPRTPADWPYAPRADLLEDVEAITALVRQQGMELLVLDQTRPDLEIPVVKVLVPGMRHFWARFAPGRLFDVPVQLGRRAEPVTYEQLNPVPLFV